MTLVTGTVQDLGYDGMEGTLWARPARFRSDGQVVYAPERKPYKVVDGVVSADLAPGPAVLELQVGSHARGTFEVVIPEEDTTLADLLDTVFAWEPAQVSLFVAEREAAELAKREAEAAAGQAVTAAGTATTAAQQTGQDRSHVDQVRTELDEAFDESTAGNVLPPRLTETALNATYATLGEVRSTARVDGTDQTATLQGEINALMAAGGGTLVLPSGTIKTGPIVLQNDGATPPKQPVLFLRGTGMHWSGRSTPPIGGTIIEFTAPDPNGRGLISTRGLGLLSLEGLTLRNRDTSISTPFIYTTNTTVHVNKCAGIGAKTSLNCDQDFFVGGGTLDVEGFGGWDDGFQGYGTYIGHNFFNGIRRIVYGRKFFNANWIEHNTIWHQCGNATGGAIELDGDPDGVGPSQSSTGNSISFNLFELPSYKYGIRLRMTAATKMIGNDGFDAQTARATVMYDIDATCVSGLIVTGFTDNRVSKVVDDRSGKCQVIEQQGTGHNVFSGATRFGSEADTLIDRPIVDGIYGLKIKPATQISEGGPVLSAYRSAVDTTDPNARILEIHKRGSLYIQGDQAGNISFIAPDGTTRAGFASGGKRWSVTEASNAQIHCYGLQLRDRADGTYGGTMFVEGGALKFQGKGGTITTIGPS